MKTLIAAVCMLFSILMLCPVSFAADVKADPKKNDAYSDYKPDMQPSELEQTWTEIDGVIYGAKPNELGPIGGGAGYARIITGDSATTTVTTVQSLMAALAQAKPGETIFIPGDAVLDMTTWIIADKKRIEIPAGVTLASDRGANGSPGALIFSDEIKTIPMIQIRGDQARVTGLRLRGPDPLIRLDFHQRCFGKGGGNYKLYYTLANSRGVQTSSNSLEVDNCEIMGWSHAGVYLGDGKNHRIHHNYLHHNQRHGLGYGVSLDTAFASIDYNLFDYCRHHIAGTGRPGSGYEAANNVTLKNANGHLFDMHGGRDRKDGTTIAGTWMKIHHNTFMDANQAEVIIRGIPEQSAEIHHNWLYRPYDQKKRMFVSDGNTTAGDNVYGIPPQKTEERYQFDKKK